MGYLLDTVRGYIRIGGVGGLASFLRSKLSPYPTKTRIQKVRHNGVASPIYLRVPSSDILTYWQVFVDEEYEISVDRDPEVIIDAGANIGLAAIYFANRFPGARILAIEPEKTNFEALKMNVEAYKSITPIRAALWNENRPIELMDPGRGNSGFMTGVENDSAEMDRVRDSVVPGVTVDHILGEHGIERVDILKMDIEGAEYEVLADPGRWIENVDSLIVELHERMKPGCLDSFERAAAYFDHRWIRGENVFVSREGSCMSGAICGRIGP